MVRFTLETFLVTNACYLKIFTHFGKNCTLMRSFLTVMIEDSSAELSDVAMVQDNNACTASVRLCSNETNNWSSQACSGAALGINSFNWRINHQCTHSAHWSCLCRKRNLHTTGDESGRLLTLADSGNAHVFNKFFYINIFIIRNAKQTSNKWKVFIYWAESNKLTSLFIFVEECPLPYVKT